MKIIDSKLYLTLPEAVECGLSTENSLWTANSKGTKGWGFKKDPDDMRKLLVGYDDLNPERQNKVQLRYGNPYDYFARTPIKNMVVNDAKANDHYMRYRYDGEKSLPITRVYQYTRAASWLNMLMAVGDDKRLIKNLKLSLPDFYNHVAALITVEKGRAKLEGYAGLDVLPADFPSTYQRLLARVDRYRNEGYDMLIDGMFGNKIGAKLGKVADSREYIVDSGEGITEGEMPKSVVKVDKNDPFLKNKRGSFDRELYERQMAVIRAISRKHQNFDAAQVAEMAKLLFDANGWKSVSRATIGNIIRENKNVLAAGRRGKRSYMDEVAMQNKRKASPFGMVYWTMDGWTAEIMYQVRTVDKEGRSKMEYKRLVLVVVLDAVNKYPIGYAIGERENTELIKQALRNALLHVYELTGTMYAPLQLQSDRYQVKNLTPFYQAVTKLYTPAEAKNAKAKVIEPYFKYLNKKYAQMTEFWTGFNLDSKKANQVNREWLDVIKENAPDRAGVVKQLERMMERERAAKQAVWLEKWELLPVADRQVVTEERYLRVMGTQLGERTNRITGQGIIKQVDGVERTYDTFDPAFRNHMNENWQLYGDLTNLSKVLAVSEDNKISFVLEEKRILPMDIYSTTQEDVDFRTRVKHYNKEQMAMVTAQTASDANITRDIIENTFFDINNDEEMDLKLLLTYGGQQKEKLQDAKRLGTGNAVALIQKKAVKQVKAAEQVRHELWEDEQRRREDELVGDFSRYL